MSESEVEIRNGQAAQEDTSDQELFAEEQIFALKQVNRHLQNRIEELQEELDQLNFTLSLQRNTIGNLRQMYAARVRCTDDLRTEVESLRERLGDTDA